MTGHIMLVFLALKSPVWSQSDGLLKTWTDSVIGGVRRIILPEDLVGNQIYSVHWSDDERTLTVTLPLSIVTCDAFTGDIRNKSSRDNESSADGSKSASSISIGNGDAYWIIHDRKTGKDLKLENSQGHALSRFSPDASILMTYDIFTGKHVAWNSVLGNRLFVLDDIDPPGSSRLYDPEFSHDGSRIITHDNKHKLVLFDAANGYKLSAFNLPQANDDENHILKVRFSPDDSELIIVTGWKNPTATFLDIRTGEMKLMLRGHTEYISSVSLSPDGLHVLTASRDKTAILWDRRTGERLMTFSHESEIFSASFNLNGTKLLTGEKNGTISIRRIGFTEQELKEANGQSSLKASIGDTYSSLDTAEKRFKLTWDSEK